MRNPAYFRGTHRRKRYFEGWYFKCISADRRHAIAVIPGMAIDPAGNRHAFIQVINAASGKTWYHHFPYEEFQAQTDRLEIRVGANMFDSHGLTLAIDRPEGRMTGRLDFSDVQPFPSTWYNPGIMGPFSFIPFMECYHAIIHLYHELHGQIEMDGEALDFTGGVGYIEKDYGRSFPQTYLWLQASHFHHVCVGNDMGAGGGSADDGKGSSGASSGDRANGNACFVFSRARIPWLGRSFPGFFAYLTDFCGIAVRFATYNRSKLSRWEVDPAQGTCSGELTGPVGTLSFEAEMAGGGRLRAPVEGLMDREIIESISAVVSVRFTDRHGKVVFDSASSEAGMEICL